MATVQRSTGAAPGRRATSRPADSRAGSAGQAPGESSAGATPAISGAANSRIASAAAANRREARRAASTSRGHGHRRGAVRGAAERSRPGGHRDRGRRGERRRGSPTTAWITPVPGLEDRRRLRRCRAVDTLLVARVGACAAAMRMTGSRAASDGVQPSPPAASVARRRCIARQATGSATVVGVRSPGSSTRQPPALINRRICARGDAGGPVHRRAVRAAGGVDHDQRQVAGRRREAARVESGAARQRAASGCARSACRARTAAARRDPALAPRPRASRAGRRRPAARAGRGSAPARRPPDVVRRSRARRGRARRTARAGARPPVPLAIGERVAAGRQRHPGARAVLRVKRDRQPRDAAPRRSASTANASSRTSRVSTVRATSSRRAATKHRGPGREGDEPEARAQPEHRRRPDRSSHPGERDRRGERPAGAAGSTGHRAGALRQRVGDDALLRSIGGSGRGLDAVDEHRSGERLHVVGPDELAPVERRVGSGRGGQQQAGAWARADGRERMPARGLEDGDDVAQQRIAGVDARDRLLRGQQPCGAPDRDDARRARAAAQQRQRLVGRRVAERDARHEAVQLGRRQRVRAVVTRGRVLRRDHGERRLDRPRMSVDGDLAFLHRLEQARLRLGGGAVELVHEQHVREDRAGHELEAGAVGPPDRRAQDVARKHVDRGLHAREATVEAARQRPGEPRLADAGVVLHQQVTAGQHRREHDAQRVLRHLHLAFDGGAQAPAQRGDLVEGRVDGLARRRARPWRDAGSRAGAGRGRAARSSEGNAREPRAPRRRPPVGSFGYSVRRRRRRRLLPGRQSGHEGSDAADPRSSRSSAASTAAQWRSPSPQWTTGPIPSCTAFSSPRVAGGSNDASPRSRR